VNPNLVEQTDKPHSKKEGTPRKSFGVFFVRRECWTLSLVGKLCLLAAIGISMWIGLINLYPFLAYSNRVQSNILVVDGWLPTYLLKQAAAEYATGHYTTVLTVQQTDPGASIDLEQTRDNYVIEILVRHGIPRDRLIPIFYQNIMKDRTYHSALAISEWFKRNGGTPSSLNLVTVGPHARRSRMLYLSVFEHRIPIGVIGLSDPSYDARRWWRSSEGIREVLFEGVAYVYAKFIFLPWVKPTAD